MKVYIKGKGEINLTTNDFVAEGGEGKVYCKGSTAYKIYNDPHKMIPLGKIQELSVLTNDNIIKPKDVLLDSHNTVIGYTMRMIKDNYTLCQLIPKSFKIRENLNHTQTFDLVKKLQDIVKHCHDNGILIVDLNEYNILVDKGFKEVFCIDVDSYQTKSFHATALMDSVRDRHSPNKFNEGTDWFSFAVTSFQMQIGIHPYKGKHDKIKDIDQRMLKNISVLNKDVSVPPVCYDFSIIPSNYLKWYDAIFEQGKRVAPPFGNEIVQLIAQKVKTISGNNKFDINEIYNYVESIINYEVHYGVKVCLTTSSVYVNNKPSVNTNNYKHFCVTNKKNHIVLGKTENGKLSLFDFTADKKLECNSNSDQLFSYNGVLYNKINDKVIEVQFLESGTDIIPTFKIVSTTMENSTEFFNGCSIQNMLGAKYVSIFPKSGQSYQIQIKELLDYHKIIDAKFSSNVLVIDAKNKNNNIDRLILRFDDNFLSYYIRKVENISITGINFVVLDSGIVASINDKEQVELFSKKKDSTQIKIIDDPIINSDMTLFKEGTLVYFSQGSKLYSLKMK